MQLRDVQAEVDARVGQFKDGYWPPLANLARLVEEVGELSRELNHRYGPKTKKATEATADLALELGDILFVVAAIANQTGVDLDQGFAAVLEKLQGRDAQRWERKE